MTDDTRKFLTEVVEALADKCTGYLLHPEREMRTGMSHIEARDVRDRCLAALQELEVSA